MFSMVFHTSKTVNNPPKRYITGTAAFSGSMINNVNSGKSCGACGK